MIIIVFAKTIYYKIKFSYYQKSKGLKPAANYILTIYYNLNIKNNEP